MYSRGRRSGWWGRGAVGGVAASERAAGGPTAHAARRSSSSDACSIRCSMSGLRGVGRPGWRGERCGEPAPGATRHQQHRRPAVPWPAPSPEVADEALHRPRRGVAQRADGVALNLLGHLPKHVNLLQPAAAQARGTCGGGGSARAAAGQARGWQSAAGGAPSTAARLAVGRGTPESRPGTRHAPGIALLHAGHDVVEPAGALAARRALQERGRAGREARHARGHAAGGQAGRRRQKAAAEGAQEGTPVRAWPQDSCL